MSHWVDGKIKIKCSLGVLRAALIKVVPQWADYIREGENVTMENYYTREKTKGFSLVVKGGTNYNKDGAPGLPYADLGFIMGDDGAYKMSADPAGLPIPKDKLEEAVATEAIKIRIFAEAQQRGWVVTPKSQQEVIIDAPRSDKNRLMA